MGINTATVQQIYVAFFNRPGDALGQAFWENKLATGTSVSQMAAAFAGSAEYKALYAGLDAAATVAALYSNLFGRTAAANETMFWGGRMLQGLESVDTIALTLLKSAQGSDATTIANKVAAATLFTNSLDTTAKIVGYSGFSANVSARAWLATVTDDASFATASASVGAAIDTVVSGSQSQTMILTTGLDNATANTFVASETYFNVDGKGPTLNTGDVLTGVANRTDNSLIVNDLTPGVANGNIPAGVKLTNIQNVTLNTSNNTAAGTGFSTVGYADVRNLTLTSNGGGADIVTAKNGDNGTAVTATHSGFTGAMTVVGGTNVTATTEGGTVTVGSPGTGRVPLATEIATGAVVVNQNNTQAGAVNVYGGTTVAVNTTGPSNTGAINIGNTASNTGNNSAGKIANASGDITVNTAGTGVVNVMGGANVSVTDTALRGAGAITVGDINRVDLSNLPKGNVTITETAEVAYNGLAGSTNNATASGAIGVFGGQNVSVTTNAANAVNIGNLGAANETALNPTGTVTVTNTGIVNNGAATGAVAITGGTNVAVTTTGANVTIGRATNAVTNQTSNPTGDVTVTETMNGNGFGRTVTIDGGKNVTVNAKGQNVNIGTSVASAPTGAVVVNQADMLTGNGNYLASTNAGNVTVDGGTTVTVKTTGGNVTVGGVVGAVNTVPSGAVSITRTFSGPGSDATAVQGGTTVGITSTKTSGTTTVGANSAALNVAGTALKDANLAPTGDVTIVNATTVGTATAYGTGAVNVNTNGAQNVSVKGGNVDNIIDVQSTLATGGANAGKAVGASTLKNVTIDGIQAADGVAVQSDALASLTVTNSKALNNTITITNNTAAHDLTITEGGNTSVTGGTNTVQVVDAKAGTVTIGDNGTASTAVLRVDAAKATAVTVNNTAAAALQIGGVATDIAKVTLKNTGNVAFNAADTFGTGNLSKAMVVDASQATGNVTAALQATTTADTTQQYLGGAGVDTLSVNSNASGWGNLVKVDGGNGSSDVLVANYAAAGTDVAMGNAANVKGFEILRLGANANSGGGNYDASGFSEVQTGAVAGSVAVTNAASGAALSLLANTATANGDNFTVGFAGANTTSTSNALTVNLGSGTTNIIAAAGGVKGTGTITANGYEAVTVNAAGGSVSATKALATNLGTSTNVATLNGLSTNGAATLTVTGTNSLALTSNTGFTSVNASANTGLVVDVTAAKVSNAGVTFTGGASLLKATGSNDTGNFKTLVTLTGTAANNIAVGESVTVNINGTTYVYTAATAAQTVATAAKQLAAAINASADVNDAVLGNTIKTGTANTAGMATVSGGNIVLTSNAAYEVAASKTATNAAVSTASLGGQEQIVLQASGNVTTAGTGIKVNFGGGNITVALADGDTTAVVATKIAAAITAATATLKPGVASATVVDGNKVLVTIQSGATAQATIDNTGVTAWAAGTGVAATDSFNMATVNNTFVSGVGGGDYTVGLGGSWNAVAHKFSAGSETITLDASTAKADTIRLVDGSVVTDNGSKGGVTKFVVGSQAASDVMAIGTGGGQSKTILANATTGVVNTVNGASTMANVLDSSGALNTALANLTYTISNGVITFGATGGNSLSQFTVNQLINAAQILVSSSTTGGADKVVAFSFNGRSYVVSSDAGNTLASGTDSKATIVELKDVASVKGFGSTFGENTIVASNVNNITKAAVDLAALATSSTLDYTGFAKATLAVAGTVAANTNVTKFQNLASSAELVVDATANTSLGLLETTQVGASGNNSLTVTMQGHASTIDRLTVNGDALVKFAANAAAQTVSDLTDASNTVNTIQVTGNNNFTLAKVVGTALTTVDATNAGGTFTFASAPAADAHNNLTVKLAGGQASAVYTSGVSNTISQALEGTGNVTLVASGGSNTISLVNGNNTVTANGANDIISVGTGTNTITATGANDVITIANGVAVTTVTVGTNATVTLGTNDVVKVAAAVTGGTTASYAATTIKFQATDLAAGDKIDFSDFVGAIATLGGSVAASQINVAGAATLADALNMAANYTMLKQVQGAEIATTVLAANTGAVDWFQFGGDTYVVAMMNNTGAATLQTGLDANDIVVKLTGMIDLTGSNFAAKVLTM